MGSVQSEGILYLSLHVIACTLYIIAKGNRHQQLGIQMKTNCISRERHTRETWAVLGKIIWTRSLARNSFFFFFLDWYLDWGLFVTISIWIEAGRREVWVSHFYIYKIKHSRGQKPEVPPRINVSFTFWKQRHCLPAQAEPANPLPDIVHGPMLPSGVSFRCSNVSESGTNLI